MRQAIPMENEELEILRQFVKERRSRLGISIAELGRRSGLSPNLIGMLERGDLIHPPKLQNLRRLARGLNVTVEEVLALVLTAELPPLALRVLRALDALPLKQREALIANLERTAELLSEKSAQPPD